MGLERLITALDFEKINLIDENSIDVYVVPMSELENDYAISLLDHLRMNGFKADMDYMARNFKSNFKQADRLNSKYVVLVGDEETKTGVLTIKDNKTKEEYKVKEEKLIEFFDDKIEE